MKHEVGRGIAGDVLPLLLLVVVEAVVEGLHLVAQSIQTCRGIDAHGLQKVFARFMRCTRMKRISTNGSPTKLLEQESARSVLRGSRISASHLFPRASEYLNQVYGPLTSCLRIHCTAKTVLRLRDGQHAMPPAYFMLDL